MGAAVEGHMLECLPSGEPIHLTTACFVSITDESWPSRHWRVSGRREVIGGPYMSVGHALWCVTKEVWWRTSWQSTCKWGRRPTFAPCAILSTSAGGTGRGTAQTRTIVPGVLCGPSWQRAVWVSTQMVWLWRGHRLGPSAFLRRRPTATGRWLPLQKTLPWTWTRTPLAVLSLRRSQTSPHHKEVTAPTNQIEPLPTTLSSTSLTRRKSPLRPGRFQQWLRTWSLCQVHPKAPGLEKHPHLPRPTVRRGRRAWRILSPLSWKLQCPWWGRVQPPGALSQMTCPHLPRPTVRRGRRAWQVLSPLSWPLQCP